MSVMIVNDETFEAIGKFFKVWKKESDEVIIKRLDAWRMLNFNNYDVRYDEDNEYNFAPFDYINKISVPLVSPEQMLNYLKFVHYQCVDYGEQLDKAAYDELVKWMEHIETEFEIDEDILDMCAWG